MNKQTRYIFQSKDKIYVARGKRLSEYKNSLRRQLLIKRAITGSSR